MKFSYFSKNLKIRPNSEALIEYQDLEYMYGYGVYETLKVRKKNIYFLKRHLDRLKSSAQKLNIDFKHDLTDIQENLKALVEKTFTTDKIQDFNIKILLIGRPRLGTADIVILPLSPIFPDRKLYKKGAKVLVVDYRRWQPEIKSLNMLPSYIYYSVAKRLGCYDVIFCKDGYLEEGSRTNLFFVKDKKLISAPLSKVLQGVTRQTVLEVACKNNFILTEKEVQLNKIRDFDGAFLTSTSSKIIPIKKLFFANDLDLQELNKLDRLPENYFEFSQISTNIKELIKLYQEYLDNQVSNISTA